MVKCNCCNNEFITNNNKLNKKNNCPFCKYKNLSSSRKTPDKEIIERINKDLFYNINFPNGYVNNKSLINFKCKICECETTRSIKFLNFSKDDCINCKTNEINSKKKLEKEQVISIIQEKLKDDYVIIEPFEYTNVHTKYKFLHKKCGKLWNSSITNIKAGKQCSCLKRSKGEEFIYDILTENNINFTREYKIKELINLRFDFGNIKLENGKLLLIEFDGIQHFEPTFGKTDEEKRKNLHKQNENDKLKDDFVANNSNLYEMIRFNYKDDQDYILTTIKNKLLKI